MKKKRRSDAGQARLTKRDLLILHWIGEQHYIRLDHLSILGALLSAEKHKLKNPEKLAATPTVKLARRLVSSGYLAEKKVIADEPKYFWLTRKGLQNTGLPFNYIEPNVLYLNHVHNINKVRLSIMRRYPSWTWISERHLRQQAEEKTHVSDAEIHTPDGEVFAIEVELTQKSKERLANIIINKSYDQRLDALYYFAPAEVQFFLRRQLSIAPLNQFSDWIVISDLPML